MTDLRTWYTLGALAVATCVRDPAARSSAGPVRGVPMSSDAPGVLHDGAVDVVITAEVVTPPPGLDGVIESVRREDWSTAHARLERLSAPEQNGREGRYLAGRIAIERQEYAQAATLLHDLGAQIPALASEIARLEASALARAGQHEQARAAYQQLATRTHAERDRALAAVEALALGDNAAAAAAMRDWADRVPDGLEPSRAWRHAGQALEATGDTDRAVHAWKRILVDEPDAAAVGEARAGLARHNAALSTDETLTRAAHLNQRARYDDVIAELTPLSGLAASHEARRLHLLGRALFYSRAHYAEAHSTLLAAAQRSDDPERDEDSFLAARALSRSDRDAEAIASYDLVASSVHGHWGDEAAFRAIWLVAHHDQIDATVERTTAFLRDRTEATPQLRSEAAWEEAWVLFNAGRPTSVAAFEQSSSLATRAMERMRGRYWAAIARMRANDRVHAIEGFRAIITERPMTWYALLAESRLRALGETVGLPAEPAPRRPAPPLPLPDNVRWLRALGFEREGGALLASQEDLLRNRLPHDRADEVIALAYLDLGEEFRAYTIAQRHNDMLDHEPTVETRWVWDCGYPRPHAHWVEAAEDENHLPRHYLFAIMRQESAFNSRDVSNARAIGLLQMIPPTTRHVAQELHIEYREELLFDPAFNIRTGGYYIGRLFAQYHGVLPRAIGAFNAGPNAMGRFVSRAPDVETDVFVERIPYDETRTYVRRVIQNLARYRYLYGPRGDDWPLRVPLEADGRVESLVDY